jgi:hypothetical protein
VLESLMGSCLMTGARFTINLLPSSLADVTSPSAYA